MTQMPKRDLLNCAPTLIPGRDMRECDLEPIDGYILTRLDGQTTVTLLSQVVGLPQSDLLERLQRLEDYGLVGWGGEPDGDEPAVPVREFEAHELNEEEVAQLNAAEELVKTRTHWELLGVGQHAAVAEIKQRYFEVSKGYHPDRFFGRQLGEHKDQLERIFRGIKIAYEVLADTGQREAYSRRHAPPESVGNSMLMELLDSDDEATTAAASPVVAADEGTEDDAKRRKLEAYRSELVARRRSQSGDKKRKSNVELAAELYEVGLEQLKDDDVAHALKSFKLAATYAPRAKEYCRIIQETEAHLADQKARDFAEAAQRFVDDGKLDKAAKAFADAAELQPAVVHYAVRAGELYLQADQPKKAHPLVEQAVLQSPGRKSLRLLAAEVSEALLLDAEAEQHRRVAETLEADTTV